MYLEVDLDNIILLCKSHNIVSYCVTDKRTYSIFGSFLPLFCLNDSAVAYCYNYKDFKGFYGYIYVHACL